MVKNILRMSFLSDQENNELIINFFPTVFSIRNL
jgi:hypothetical protein